MRVGLTKPDVTIYVEVREKKAYVFHEYVPGPGGLPMDRQGKVIGIVESDQDALAVWMLMKRGCRVTVLSTTGKGVDILERWDPHLKVISGIDIDEAVHDSKAQAVVLGLRMSDIQVVKGMHMSIPVFFPLIGINRQ